MGEAEASAAAGASAGPESAAPPAVRCRLLESVPELEACEEIQRRAFGYADIDIVPTNELRSVAKSGGLVFGASLGEASELVGFGFGLLGREPATGELYHASRMIAVVPGHRRAGVATALKRFQREAALAQGLTTMRWTFDPLRFENAKLNLRVLGATGFRYHRDYFGESTSSPLHLGIGTDRLEVTWDLARPIGPRLGDLALLSLPDRVELPLDVSYLQLDFPELALGWRERVREGLERGFAAGHEVLGLIVDARGKPFYAMGPRAVLDQYACAPAPEAPA